LSFADFASLFLLCILIAWAAVRPMARGAGERCTRAMIVRA
jgi:hypothetical protein